MTWNCFVQIEILPFSRNFLQWHNSISSPLCVTLYRLNFLVWLNLLRLANRIIMMKYDVLIEYWESLWLFTKISWSANIKLMPNCSKSVRPLLWWRKIIKTEASTAKNGNIILIFSQIRNEMLKSIQYESELVSK